MIDPAHSGTNQYSAINPTATTYKPYYFKTDLLAYGNKNGITSIELTSTSHGALIRITYPEYDSDSDFNQTRRVIIGLNGGGDGSSIGSLSDGAISITGTSTSNSGGVPDNSDYGHRFVIGIYTGDEGNKPVTSDLILASSADKSNAWVDFRPEDEATRVLTLRIATSFISTDQALVNLNSEVPTDLSFDSIMESSRDEWNGVLGRTTVEALHSSYTSTQATDILTTFYSSLYRASLFPRQLSEYTSTGEEVHWSPYSTSNTHIFNGPITTDSGFWDAYSTVCKYHIQTHTHDLCCPYIIYRELKFVTPSVTSPFSHVSPPASLSLSSLSFIDPLLSLVNVPVLSVTLQGWVNAYKEGGWLPKWASPGYRGSMVGTMGDVSVADAIVKGIPNFDAQVAYEMIVKDAYTPSDSSEGTGRECLDSYLKYGYVPQGFCSEVVSRTLDYYQSDFAIAQAAIKLGDSSTASDLMKRASNYSVLFDFETGMMRPREPLSARFSEPFDEFAWGGAYTEAGPWQYRFSIPFDAVGLAKLYEEANQDMCDELEKAQTSPSIYHIGGYGSQVRPGAVLPLSPFCSQYTDIFLDP
jgi:putative alpha-1,2-mannosidase